MFDHEFDTEIKWMLESHFGTKAWPRDQELADFYRDFAKHFYQLGKTYEYIRVVKDEK